MKKLPILMLSILLTITSCSNGGGKSQGFGGEIVAEVTIKDKKITEVKEVRLSTFIEEHDIQVKAKTAGKFLKDGDKVKVSLRLRGRERDYASKAMEVMEKFAEGISEIAIIEKKPSFEGRGLMMVLAPKPDK